MGLDRIRLPTIRALDERVDVLAQRREHLPAAHLRHHPVEKYHVNLVVDPGECRWPVFGRRTSYSSVSHIS